MRAGILSQKRRPNPPWAAVYAYCICGYMWIYSRFDVCMHICLRVRMYACVYSRTCTQTSVYSMSSSSRLTTSPKQTRHVYVYAYAHVRACMRVYKFILVQCTYAHRKTPTQTNVYMHACTHPRVRVQVHAFEHALDRRLTAEL